MKEKTLTFRFRYIDSLPEPSSREKKRKKSALEALNLQKEEERSPFFYFYFDMRSSNEFLDLKGICDIARKLIETKKDIVYPLVYLLPKLVLILPVATATVERSFSVMKYIKNRLRN